MATVEEEGAEGERARRWRRKRHQECLYRPAAAAVYLLPLGYAVAIYLLQQQVLLYHPFTKGYGNETKTWMNAAYEFQYLLL